MLKERESTKTQPEQFQWSLTSIYKSFELSMMKLAFNKPLLLWFLFCLVYIKNYICT